MAEPDNTGPDEAGADKTGADKTGADRTGAAKAGAGETGAAKAGAGKSGAGEAGADKAGADKEGPGKAGAGEAGADKAGADKAGADKAGADKAPEGKAQSPAGSRAASRASAPEGTAGTGEQSAAAGARASRATLKLHHLRPAPGAHRDKNRKGRGEASKGKTAGRGTKGTRARDTVPPGFEGGQMPLHRRVPKLKGFSNSAFKTTYQVVNLDRLTALYPSGGDVTPDDLAARGAVRKGVPVKILGTGEAGASLRVTAHAFSGSAREKITAAGGSVTEL